MDDFVRQKRTNRGAGATESSRPLKPWNLIGVRATAPLASDHTKTESREWSPKASHISLVQSAGTTAMHNRHVISLHIPRHPIKMIQAHAVKKSAWLLDTKVMQWLQHFLPHRRKYPWLARLGWGFMALLVLSTLFINVFDVRQQTTGYALSAAAEELLPTANSQFAEKVSYDSKTAMYQYNQGYTASAAGALSSGGPRFIAKVAADVSTGGVSVTDPENNVSMTLIPQFATRRGEQDGNRIVYPLIGTDAQKVYTLGATGIKEDIILNKFQANTASFSYKLQLPSGTEARLLTNGGLGVYGVSSTLLGNVTTSSEKDAALLAKARTNGAKTNLLFTLPAPYVKEAGGIGASQTVQSYYEYKNNILTVNVNGLAAAAYPLTIDPTIYIDTASNFMSGNNESNIEFDGTNDTIKKGKTTGARINAWTPSLGMPAAVWDQGTIASNGYVYSIGGATNGTAGKTVYNSAGARTFTVPAGVTSITVKAWGGGGGGGAGTGSSGVGGNGGGAGNVNGTITVTAGEVLNVNVGSGGSAAKAVSDAGNGGGASSIKRNSTVLLTAPGGGGGGGSNTTTSGGAGGGGGAINTSGVAVNGAAGTSASGGGGGFGVSPGGTAGTGGTGGAAGAAGILGAGGDGGGSMAACTTATTTTGGAGGTGAGGNGGDISANCVGGGGGGGGYYGGGGGGGGSNAAARGGGGGGGGSGYIIAGSSSMTGAVGSGTTPGTSGDADLTLPNSGGTGGTGGAGNVSVGANTAGLNGVVSISYTLTTGPTATSKVYWAQFNPSTDVVQSPTPGSDGVVCTSWCNNAAYDLPLAASGRRGMTVAAYNGFLYVLGGFNSSGTRTNTVYIAKLGAKGEPQMWHPTDSNKANWVYWYPSTVNLPDDMNYSSAVAYNNGLYLFGGQTTTTPGGDARVWRTDILPTGDILSWSTTGMQTIPTGSFSAGRYGHSVQVYNDTLYIVGGRDTGTNFRSDVWYSKLNSDGTMNAWKQTSDVTIGSVGSLTLTAGRVSLGGTMTAIWGGYLYLSGGCTAVNVGGYCTTYANDVRLASINADGSLGPWGAVANIVNKRVGGSTLTWQGALYRVGGCETQNTAADSCDNLLSTVDYGTINPDGDASTVSTSSAYSLNGGVPIAGNPCSGYAAGSQQLTNCDLPAAGAGAGQGGQMSSMTVISNGYIYDIGGCTLAACTSMSPNISYAVLNSNGSMTAPATCPNGSYAALWCVDNVNAVAGSTATVGGTITQTTTTTVTGSGTAFTGHTGDILRYNDGTTALITNVTSGTQMTVNVTKNIGSGQSYTIYKQGLGAAAATVFNGNIYLIGGTDGGGTWTSNVQFVPLANNGSLSAHWTIVTTATTGIAASGLPSNFPAVTTANAAITLGAVGIGYGYAFARSNPSLAATFPGNLYILGGCVGNSAIGCAGGITNSYSNGVYKCRIAPSGLVDSCSTTNQLQIDGDQNTANNPSGLAAGQGVGLMAGTVYANRIYLVGGACTSPTSAAASDPCGSDFSANRQDTIYAKIDNSNNIVVNDASVTTWKLATGKMSPVRRRAISFGYNGYIYSLAGYSGVASLQDLLFSKIDVSTGDMGSWSSSGVVVSPRWDLRAIVSNGYVYAIGGCAAGAAPTCTVSSMQPQIQTFQLYNNDSGAAALYGNETNPLTAAGQRIGTSSVILNGYIYNAGGCSDVACTTFTNANKVYYAPIDAYGVIGTWHEATFSSLGTNLPVSLAWGKLVAAGNTLYYVGGQTGQATTTAVNTIYYTTSFNTGAPTWSVTAASGGIGDLTGAPAAQPRTQAGVTVWNNRIYVVGGYGGASTVSTVYYSPDLSSGGNIAADSWISSTAITVARAGLALVAYANNLYVLGGYDGTNYLNDTQFASIGYKTGTMSQAGTAVSGAGGASWSTPQIAVGMTLLYPADGTTATITNVGGTTSLTVNVSRTIAAGTNYQIYDGSVGNWTPSTSLPGPLRDAEGFGANGYIYLLGGRNVTSCTPSTLVTPVSANTTILSGNNPTGIGEWYETNQRYTSDRYGAGVAYANGRAYIMGGGCSAMVASAVAGDTWLQTSALKSQPQVAKYSKMIDTDNDVYAAMWLTNGVDNSTGARWSLKYRSMNDPKQTDLTKACGGSVMPGWGQETNFGSIQLAKPGVYTPKNVAGTSISCSRFYYLALSIDSSQAFGYPEDNNRGPYISDISLYYTASASGRLIHGKTFSGGLQQPLDTPCRTSNNSSDPNYAACPLP